MNLDLSGIGSIHDLVGGRSMTADELRAAVSHATRVLMPYAGDTTPYVVIAHANSPEFFADLFAVWSIGGCAVCVNAGLTDAELANVVTFVGASVVLFGEGDSPPDLVDVEGLCTARAPAAQGECSPRGHLDDPALILFTSGTTGDPKGVRHTMRSLLARISLNQCHLEAGVLARSLCVLPTHFGHGLIGNCLTPLLCGGDLFLMHGAGVAGSAKLGATIDEHAITFMSSVPSFWKMALKLSPPPSNGSLQRVNIGSAPLSAELWGRVIEWSGTRDVANMYGITETANWIGGALASEFEPEDGLLGRCWGGRYAVVDEHGQLRAEGEGEIAIQVPSLLSGYHLRDDLTSEVLRAGWYFTGDVGAIDAEGVLRMTGRTKYAINRAGIKIYPEEIDLLLERHPSIEEACTFGTEDAISGEAVAAAVRLVSDSGVTAQEIKDWVAERIRREAVPQQLFFLQEIPKTDRGKLNRANVAAHCSQRGAD